MHKQIDNIVVFPQCVDWKDTPCCEHGPCLLFQKCLKGNEKKFYSCAAYRDRKQCSIYVDVDDKSKGSIAVQKLNSSQISQTLYQERRKRFEKLAVQERSVCKECRILILPEERRQHVGHNIKLNVTDALLQRPTRLICTLEDNKANAQYWFSDSSIQLIASTIQSLGIEKVLCIGTPKIHEFIRQSYLDDGTAIQSLLLDFDSKLAQFFSDKEFGHYNVFNHYFFDKASQKVFEEFVQDDSNVLVIVDPPFGGFVEVLLYTLNKIERLWKKSNSDKGSMPMFVVLPYFMEAKIKEHSSKFDMLDYKVTYESHKKFCANGKPNARGSPVRIFSTVHPSIVVLPQPEYRFCDLCNRYVSCQNRHCVKCDKCTTKDGHTYVHCDVCGFCVKPSRVHCTQCRCCHLPDEQCGKRKTTGCYICGSLDHKRSACGE